MGPLNLRSVVYFPVFIVEYLCCPNSQRFIYSNNYNQEFCSKISFLKLRPCYFGEASGFAVKGFHWNCFVLTKQSQ